MTHDARIGPPCMAKLSAFTFITLNGFFPTWQGCCCVASDVVDSVRSLKEGDRDMTILGSGSIVGVLAARRTSES
jgi:hypothetical protein